MYTVSVGIGILKLNLDRKKLLDLKEYGHVHEMSIHTYDVGRIHNFAVKCNRGAGSRFLIRRATPLDTNQRLSTT